MRLRVAVLGAGSWGTTVAMLASHNAPTTIWARRDDLAGEINARTRTSATSRACAFRPRCARRLRSRRRCATPTWWRSAFPRTACARCSRTCGSHIRPWVPLVSLVKGLEEGSLLRMTQVIHDVLPDHRAGVLTGPNLAREIVAGFAAASVIAIDDEMRRAPAPGACSTPGSSASTPIATSTGCELGGALKNVIAIASGMGDGLGVGDNTRSAVITRGLAEITRLGVAMGGRPETFSGLAGMGDLIATCISPQSRNRHVGEQLGKGRPIDEIVAQMHMVAEGVKTTRVVMELRQEIRRRDADRARGLRRAVRGPQRARRLPRADAQASGRRGRAGLAPTRDSRSERREARDRRIRARTGLSMASAAEPSPVTQRAGTRARAGARPAPGRRPR